MQILGEIGTLKDGRTILMVKDAYNPNYVIARNYDREMGCWDSATYCDGSLVSLAKNILESELTVGYDRLKDMFQNYVNNDVDAADPEYVRNMLEQVGVDDENVDDLGFGWLYPEGGLS